MKVEVAKRLQVCIIRMETEEIKKIEANNNIDDIFNSSTDGFFVALMYYGWENDILGLEKWLDICRNVHLTEFQLVHINHYSGILAALKKDFVKSEKFLKDSLNYLDTHREKLIIDNINYGRDYKAMVMSDLATLYLKLNKFTKSRNLYERANNIYYYKTNNRARSYSCMFGLGTIELRLHNVWQAKTYFRNVERASILRLKNKVALNLSFVYYLLRDYKKSMQQINKLKPRFKTLSETQKIYLMLTEALTNSAKGRIREVNEIFIVIDEMMESVNDEELNKIYKLQKIISFQKSNKDDIHLIKNELIPYFLDQNLIQYTALSMEYIEKVGK